MSIINKLTEGIVRRDLSKEGNCSSQQVGKDRSLGRNL